MHYPHKSSNIKRARKIGFRARMKTKKGRQMINRKRAAGRAVQVV
jgi:large subunit ribosomal protein L34